MNIRDANASLYLCQLRVNKIDDPLPANSGNLSMVDNMTVISNLLLYIKPLLFKVIFRQYILYIFIR